MPFHADYNNYYGGGNIVGEYNNNAITTILLWQAATGQDAHSVSISSIFTFSDTAFLELSSNAGFYCPVLKVVSKDINAKDVMDLRLWEPIQIKRSIGCCYY